MPWASPLVHVHLVTNISYHISPVPLNAYDENTRRRVINPWIVFQTPHLFFFSHRTLAVRVFVYVSLKLPVHPPYTTTINAQFVFISLLDHFIYDLSCRAWYDLYTLSREQDKSVFIRSFDFFLGPYSLRRRSRLLPCAYIYIYICSLRPLATKCFWFSTRFTTWRGGDACKLLFYTCFFYGRSRKRTVENERGADANCTQNTNVQTGLTDGYVFITRRRPRTSRVYFCTLVKFGSVDVIRFFFYAHS